MSACACVAATSIACVPMNPRHPAHERVAQRRRDKAICHCRQRMAVQRAGLGERLWRWCQHTRRGNQKPAAYRAQMALRPDHRVLVSGLFLLLLTAAFVLNQTTYSV